MIIYLYSLTLISGRVLSRYSFIGSIAAYLAYNIMCLKDNAIDPSGLHDCNEHASSHGNVEGLCGKVNSNSF